VLRRQFTATCAKELAAPTTNEDAYILRLGQNRAAVFDGATESFAARRWARLLASYWGRHADADWVGLARNDYARHVDAMSLSWAQEAAVQRGSYATIVAIDTTSGALEVTVVGDSCAFLLAEDDIVWSHPFDSDEQFTSAPEAIGTHPDHAAADAEALLRAQTLIDPGSLDATLLLLATDALSAWLLPPDLDDRRRRVRELLQCLAKGDFETLVASERRSGALKVDDCTVVVLSLGDPR
jgi:serine/threonine protein phosphatase PrpC